MIEELKEALRLMPPVSWTEDFFRDAEKIPQRAFTEEWFSKLTRFIFDSGFEIRTDLMMHLSLVRMNANGVTTDRKEIGLRMDLNNELAFYTLIHEMGHMMDILHNGFPKVTGEEYNEMRITGVVPPALHRAEIRAELCNYLVRSALGLDVKPLMKYLKVYNTQP